MKVQVLVSGWCAACRQTEQVWRAMWEEREFEFEVVDLGQPEGRALINRIGPTRTPAVIIDGRLQGVGAMTQDQARTLAAGAPARTGSPWRFFLALSRASRSHVLAAIAYLVVGGTLLVFGGAGGSAVRAIALYAFSVGSLVFLAYGLAEHLLPRFVGRPLWNGVTREAQMAFTHGAVLSLASGWFMDLAWLKLGGAVLAWIGLAIFLVRLVPLLLEDAKSGS